MRAYQGNAQANVERTITITYPRSCQAVGQTYLSALGWRYFLQHPDSSGDWALSTHGFADFVEKLDAIAEHDIEYLPDLLRLEWACQHAERAENEILDARTLSLLEEQDAKRLRLVFGKDMSLLRSLHPLDQLAQLNEINDRLSPNERASIIDSIKEHYDESSEQFLCIYREGYKARYIVMNAGLFEWLSAAKSGLNFDELVSLTLAHDLELSTVLQTLISRGWLKRIETM